MMRRLFALTAAGIAGIVAFAVVPAFAITVWTNWTSATDGFPGSATGTLNGVGVTSSGEVIASVTTGTSAIWAPNTSFTGGTVTASPRTVGHAIRLRGSFTRPHPFAFAAAIDG